MAVHLAPGITLEGFDPRRSDDVDILQGMFIDYLLEEFQRIGELAFGNPVANYLATTFIRREGEEAGFMSLDGGRQAVELIYVKPEFRGQGLAELALQETDRVCPNKLALKTPLTPGGEALANRLELDRADNFPHEAAKNAEFLQSVRDRIKQTCPHGKKSGDPRKPCARCYRKFLRSYAARGMEKYVAPFQ
ncbi:GNAT family N-acetyltransferase [Streptomyces scabiei]|uniref:GNAT family N-acetyltransferase n=1 Tax=Streptomyces scabiei TaxID=1930 RepID=UPI000765935A|nr:GNAT family N-acetyltransferase [Streptomyces scabiei]MDX2999208.1 GNAT family N-acetyltransferase [Streptomyces scabiei]MDX3052628.1 GNAT family N-acetyltransferase [Streptomyces scabiei]